MAGPHRAGGSATHRPGSDAKVKASGRRDFASRARCAALCRASRLRPLLPTMLHQPTRAVLGSPAHPATCHWRGPALGGVWLDPGRQCAGRIQPSAVLGDAAPASPWPHHAHPAQGQQLGAEWHPEYLGRRSRARSLVPQWARPAGVWGGCGEPGAFRERSEDSSDGFALSSRTRTSPGWLDAEPPPSSACWGGGRAAALPQWLWGPPN